MTAYNAQTRQPIHSGLVISETDSAYLISNEHTKLKTDNLCIEWFAKLSTNIYCV